MLIAITHWSNFGPEEPKLGLRYDESLYINLTKTQHIKFEILRKSKQIT